MGESSLHTPDESTAPPWVSPTAAPRTSHFFPALYPLPLLPSSHERAYLLTVLLVDKWIKWAPTFHKRCAVGRQCTALCYNGQPCIYRPSASTTVNRNEPNAR